MVIIHTVPGSRIVDKYATTGREKGLGKALPAAPRSIFGGVCATLSSILYVSHVLVEESLDTSN